jgi:hypothetical protein
MQTYLPSERQQLAVEPSREKVVKQTGSNANLTNSIQNRLHCKASSGEFETGIF